MAPSGHHLGEWLHAQRTADLSAQQLELLTTLGFQPQRLSPHEQSWQRQLAAARRYHAEHGHLDVPQSYVDVQGVRLGVFINNFRRRLAQQPAERIQALTELGFTAESTSKRRPDLS